MKNKELKEITRGELLYREGPDKKVMLFIYMKIFHQKMI